MEQHAIVLFDGNCNLCNSAVRFIIKRDPSGYFQFAPLQSRTGERLLTDRGVTPSLRSIVLVEGGRVHTGSDAALRVCSNLSGFWRMLSVLRLIPRPVREPIYRWIANNRYRWFGRTEVCLLPTAELKSRFLD